MTVDRPQCGWLLRFFRSYGWSGRPRRNILGNSLMILDKFALNRNLTQSTCSVDISPHARKALSKRAWKAIQKPHHTYFSLILSPMSVWWIEKSLVGRADRWPVSCSPNPPLVAVTQAITRNLSNETVAFVWESVGVKWLETGMSAVIQSLCSTNISVYKEGTRNMFRWCSRAI